MGLRPVVCLQMCGEALGQRRSYCANVWMYGGGDGQQAILIFPRFGHDYLSMFLPPKWAMASRSYTIGSCRAFQRQEVGHNFREPPLWRRRNHSLGSGTAASTLWFQMAKFLITRQKAEFVL